MGILYDSVKQIDFVKNMKREIVLDRLLKLGVTESQQRKSIHTLSYEELKYELVLLNSEKSMSKLMLTGGSDG